MATARERNYELIASLERAGIDATYEQVNTLRRASLTLSRWGERECGDGSNYYLERDEETGKTYNVHVDTGRRYPTPDLERGAIRRIGKVCADLGIHWYYQTDPRGCALYVSREPLDHSNYTNGVAIY